jgi:hypothetical protein
MFISPLIVPSDACRDKKKDAAKRQFDELHTASVADTLFLTRHMNHEELQKEAT